MATISNIRIDLDLMTSKFNRSVKRVRGQMTDLRKAAGLLSGTFGALVPAAGAAGLGVLVSRAVEGQAALFDLSNRLGASTEELSRLQYAAEQSGVSVQTLNLGLQRQVRRIAEAAKGQGEAVKALDELNLSAERLNQLSPDQQFKVLAESISQVENPADRVRLAMKLFDSEGVALIQTMTEGAEGLQKYAEEADALGVTVSQLAAADAKAASDAFTRIGASVEGVGNALAVQLAPHLVELGNWLAVEIPKAAEFTIKAFNLARAGVLQIVAGIQEYYSGIFGLLSRLPGEFGKTFKSLSESMADGAEKNRKAMDDIFEGVVKAGDGMRKYRVEAVQAAAATKQLNVALQEGESNQDDESETPVEKQLRTLRELESEMNKVFTRIEKRKAEGNEKEEAEEKNHLETMANLQLGASKKATQISKGAALVNATIKGYEAIQAALAAPPGFPYNLPQVALVTAQQFANVAAIRAQSYEGGGFTGMLARVGGIDGRGGFPAILHGNETVIDNTKGAAASMAVTFNVGEGFDEKAERKIYEMIQSGSLQAALNGSEVQAGNNPVFGPV